MVHLDHLGLAVPRPIPAADGRRHVDGLVVMEFVEGRPPQGEDEWRRVADYLGRLHEATRGWKQRPGWLSSQDLLVASSGTRIDLTRMPPEAVARCRGAWARLTGRATSVVHGDLNPNNVRLSEDRVALIDWDESRVDVSDLDLALPHGAGSLRGARGDAAMQASAAWEAAICWDDDHARECLTMVRAS